MPTHIANYSGVPLDINAWESTGGNNAGFIQTGDDLLDTGRWFAYRLE